MTSMVGARKLTVTIGIPAYNEEQNIRFLVKDLLKQKQVSFQLRKIIICSDASSDSTEEEVKKIRNSKVKLILNKTRKGQASSQNEIISRCHSDILVLLNADVKVKDNTFLEELIKPILQNKADLTSAMIKELSPLNLLENILLKSMEIKKQIFDSYKNGNNIYTCHGRARAFARKFYKTFSFKETIVDEDAYSYLYCVSHNYKYEFAKNAKVFYRLPGNLRDHERQSLRFLSHKGQLMNEFGKDFVNNQYHLPVLTVIKYFFMHFLKSPTSVIAYITLFGWLKIKSIFSKHVESKWDISSSSKMLQRGDL